MIKNAKDTTSEIAPVTRKEYDKLLLENEYLKQQLAELKRMIFGSKRERFIPSDTSGAAQLSLFETAAENASQQEETEEIVYTRTKQSSKKKQIPVRVALPSHLARVEEIVEPDNIAEGSKKIGEEVTEILEYNPSKLYVRKIVRPKYALPEDKGVVIGDLPTLPIPKGNAGPGLLANIMVSKYVDHLPFYRQIKIFGRQGVELSDSTFNGWFNATAELLLPLYETLEKELLQSDYLQADGYTVYQNLRVKGDITLLGCMAHARRYFEKALDNDKRRAEQALMLFQKLYDTERKCRRLKLDATARTKMRQEESIPVLNQIRIFLAENISIVPPKSAIGKAISYTTNIWSNLERYIEDGRYEIDNNMIENTIRPLALGRKNYLFAGSHKAAQRTAMMYSFFATCKINVVEPFAWLKDVLIRIPDHKANKLHELLPVNWKENQNSPSQ